MYVGVESVTKCTETCYKWSNQNQTSMLTIKKQEDGKYQMHDRKCETLISLSRYLFNNPTK